MSIIGSFTAEPNRVEMLIEFLKKEKNLYTKSKLEKMFSPQSSSIFREVYGIVDSLGLITIEKDIVALKIENREQSTFEIIKKSIFRDDSVEKDSLLLALSWLLIQNSQTLSSLEWSGQVNNMVLKDLNKEFGELDLTNSARWQHFGYWAIYLGFATKISIGGENYLCPDPTKAIELELNNVFRENKELPIRNFFEYLAKSIFVLEFGSIRDKVGDYAREGLSLPYNLLSFSTSLALLRLEKRGLISLEQKSDADSFSLQRDKENSRIISHVIYKRRD